MRQVAGENHAPEFNDGADMCRSKTATLIAGSSFAYYIVERYKYDSIHARGRLQAHL